MIRNQKIVVGSFCPSETALNNSAVISSDFELDRPDRSLIPRQISDLQAELRTNPMNNKDDSWLKLGHLEFTLGNYLEAIACFELHVCNGGRF